MLNVFQLAKRIDKVKLPVEAAVTNQVQEDKAWLIIKGEQDSIRRVRIGQLVEKAPM